MDSVWRRAWELSAERNTSEKQTWNSGQKEVKGRGLDFSKRGVQSTENSVRYRRNRRQVSNGARERPKNMYRRFKDKINGKLERIKR